MRAPQFFTHGVCLLTFAAIGLTEEPAREAKATGREAPPAPAVSAPNAALLDGLSVAGTMKQIIGSFDTYGNPSPGCTFELSFAKLPERTIDFTRPADARGADQGRAYVPVRTPLAVELVDGKQGFIRLASPNDQTKLTIEIHANEFARGAKARIYFLELSYGKIRCMAEAEGVLQ